MLRGGLLAGIAATVIPPSFGQTVGRASTPPAQPSSAKPPDSTYFKFFFLHVERVQSAADALKTQGKEDLPMRNAMKNEAEILATYPYVFLATGQWVSRGGYDGEYDF